MRDVVKEVLSEVAPAERVGSVTALDSFAKNAKVKYPDEATPVDVFWPSSIDVGIGATVVVAGRLGDRFIDRVIGPTITQGITRRNLLDNGAQRVIQKGSSQASVGTSDTYLVDRWLVRNNALGVYTIGNTTLTGFGVPLPLGNSAEKRVSYISTTTTDTPAAGDYLIIAQYLEGRNLQHLCSGTSAAKPLTFSGWTYVTTGGVHYAELQHPVSGKCVSKPFTFSAGWNYFSMTVPGLTTDSIADSNAGALVAQMWVAAGTTWTGGTHPGVVWHSTSANRAPGQSNAIPATNGRVFGWTEWQLEAGSQATPFEVVDFPEEFTRCRRYFRRDVDPMARGVFNVANVAARLGYWLEPEMRIAPTLGVTGGVVYDGFASYTLTSIAGGPYLTSRSVEIDFNISGGPSAAGRGALIYNGSGSNWDLSANL